MALVPSNRVVSAATCLTGETNLWIIVKHNLFVFIKKAPKAPEKIGFLKLWIRFGVQKNAIGTYWKLVYKSWYRYSVPRPRGRPTGPHVTVSYYTSAVPLTLDTTQSLWVS